MSGEDAVRAARASDSPGFFSAGRGLWAPLTALGLVVAAVAWSWSGFMLREQQEEYWHALDAVAELKAQQLADWVELHRRSASAIASAEWLAEQFETWRETGDPGVGERLFTRLAQLAHAGRFSAAVLADGDGRPLWSGFGNHPHTDTTPKATWVAAAASGTAALVGPYLDGDGNLHLDYVVAWPGAGDRARGIVVLHTGAEDYLPERFTDFPLPLESGEVVLVRREGEDVVQLSLAHSDPRTALQMRAPLGNGQRPAAQLLLATSPGPLRALGPDLDGRELMKSGRRVEGTDWMVLASIETREVRRQSMGVVLWITLLGALLFLASGAAVVVLRQQRRLAGFHTRDRERDAQLRDFHLLHAVADSSKDPVFVKDVEGRYTLVNRACCEFLGRPSHEVIGRTDHELFPPDQAAELTDTHRQVVEHSAISTTREVLASAKGQRVIMATKGPLHDREGRLMGVYGIARDITELERSSQELESRSEELARRNQELERFNEAMVGRELDMLRLKHEINELCAQLGHEPRYGRELVHAQHDSAPPESEA